MSEIEWKDFIGKIRSEVGDTLIEDKKKSEELLEKAIIEAVKKGIVKKGKVGVCFSGGVDSTTISMILKRLNADFTCYSVGTESAEDLVWAKRAAKEFGFRLKTKVLTDNDIEKILKKLAGFIEEFDIIKAGVGCVTYAAIELAKKDKIKVIFTGLGSEEIFAGYQRHLESKNVNEECWKGLSLMYKRDMIRDMPIAEKFKIKVCTPFLDKEVISIAMRIPDKYKINMEQNKIILREVAERESIGLTREFSQRKKRAAQYGSRIDKAIERIGKKNGFRKKSDYIRSLASAGQKNRILNERILM
ncbi:MAG: asparagine synthase C-terminal domain-containing protein [Candidatus Woesearchaeota archaeon]|nr:asparagine synthase C-terminal domain-containing protein [Candidatus Woesearchaeota archaeon]